jgi:hypothetical protein
LTATVTASAGLTPSGTGTQVRGVDQQRARPAADLRHRGVAAADHRGVHVLADGAHRADHVVARHKGEGRLVVVLAAAHLLLGERHAGRLHPQDDLPLGGRRQVTGADLQSARLDLAGQDDLGGAVHDASPVFRRRVLTSVNIRSLAKMAQEITYVSFHM